MRQGQSLSRLLAATTAALLLIGYSLEIPQNPFATNHCTAHQDTHQVPTTCTIIDLDESDSGLSLQVRQSAEIDIPMQDWFNGDIDNITDSSTWVLTPEDADTGSALNGHWGGQTRYCVSGRSHLAPPRSSRRTTTKMNRSR